MIFQIIFLIWFVSTLVVGDIIRRCETEIIMMFRLRFDRCHQYDEWLALQFLFISLAPLTLLAFFMVWLAGKVKRNQ